MCITCLDFGCITTSLWARFSRRAIALALVEVGLLATALAQAPASVYQKAPSKSTAAPLPEVSVLSAVCQVKTNIPESSDSEAILVDAGSIFALTVELGSGASTSKPDMSCFWQAEHKSDTPRKFACIENGMLEVSGGLSSQDVAQYAARALAAIPRRETKLKADGAPVWTIAEFLPECGLAIEPFEKAHSSAERTGSDASNSAIVRQAPAREQNSLDQAWITRMETRALMPQLARAGPLLTLKSSYCADELNDACRLLHHRLSVRFHGKDQVIEFSEDPRTRPESLLDCNPTLIRIVDANFDGWNDVLLLTSQFDTGAGLTQTRLYRWNPANNQLAEAPEVRDMTDVAIDPLSMRLRSQIAMSAALRVNTLEYAWRGTKLVPMRGTNIVLVPDESAPPQNSVANPAFASDYLPPDLGQVTRYHVDAKGKEILDSITEITQAQALALMAEGRTEFIGCR